MCDVCGTTIGHRCLETPIVSITPFRFYNNPGQCALVLFPSLKYKGGLTYSSKQLYLLEMVQEQNPAIFKFKDVTDLPKDLSSSSHGGGPKSAYKLPLWGTL